MNADFPELTGVRVAKLGGSLLRLADFPARLQRCLNEANQRKPLATLLVVGGGGLIDAVRELDAIHALDARVVHHECIGLLSFTARLTRQLLPGADYLVGEEQIVRFLDESAFCSSQFAIVDIQQAMPYLARNAKLPEDWSTTTDALSAALAIATNADELLILKSADPPARGCGPANDSSRWLDALADIGFIDVVFPILADRLRDIRFVNLRAAGT